MTAVQAGVTIVIVQEASYEFVDSAALLARLDSRLSGDAAAMLRRRGHALIHCAWVLSSVLPACPVVLCGDEGISAALLRPLLRALREAAPPLPSGSLER